MANKQKKTTIDPNKIKTRDELLKNLIQGATKSNIATDRKKEKNKQKARKSRQRYQDLSEED